MMQHTLNRLLSLLVLSSLMGGCFRYHAAEGDLQPATPVGDGAWVVSADTSALERLLDTPEEVVLWELDQEAVRKKYPDLTQEEFDQTQEQMKLRLEHAEIRNGGIVRFWGSGGSGVNWTRTLNHGPFSIKLEDFESRGDFLSAERLAYVEATEGLGSSSFPFAFMESMLKLYGIHRTNAEQEWRLKEGIRIGLPQEPEGGEEHELAERLGTVVHIASFYENSYEHRVLDRLAAYGWAIGHIGSDVEIEGPNMVAKLKQARLRSRYMDELIQNDPAYERVRKTVYGEPSPDDEPIGSDLFMALGAKTREKYPILDTGLEVYPDTDLKAHGQMLADLVDQRIAEHAYAAEALIDQSDRLNPDLADKPIVVVGFSAGALISPAVAARMRESYPDRRIALVMIGGGGDLLSTSIQSVFVPAKIDLEPRDGPQPTQEQLDELVKHYRAASKLDPLALASVVRDLPTLHLYAQRDKVVPTSAAQAFNEAHGHVDRLVHPFTHETLFFAVPGEVGRIRTWLRSHGLGN